jgi:hypothetical protein
LAATEQLLFVMWSALNIKVCGVFALRLRNAQAFQRRKNAGAGGRENEA